MDIKPLTPEVCDRVAHLHMLYLPTPFSGRAGCELLTRYYLAICSHQGANGFVALEDGALAGFICGVWNASEVQSTLLRSYGVQMAWWSLCQLFAEPALIDEFISRFLTVQSHAPIIETHEESNQLELRPIVVIPEARGTGVAQQLISRLREDARELGFRTIYLYTEPFNFPAQRLYTKVGFQEIGYRILRSSEYIYFELGTS